MVGGDAIMGWVVNEVMMFSSSEKKLGPARCECLKFRRWTAERSLVLTRGLIWAPRHEPVSPP